jgi:hypothetical protein
MIDSLTNSFISDLDPLIVTSPTPRSGTTLLQRLLCSSPRALIYGELCAQDLQAFLNLYILKLQTYNYRKPALAAGLRKVLAGEVNDWILDLMPDVDAYLTAIGQSAFAGIASCRDYASSVGREVWGFKQPGWTPATIRLLRAVMPRARFIFIHRDLVDCVKSAKATQLINSQAEVTEFCQAWVENLTYMLGVSDESAVLLLSYEELLKAPQPVLERLAKFAGAKDMDPGVLLRKVNTSTGEDYVMQSRNGYRKPAELDDAEMRIVSAATAGLREPLYTR